MADRETYDELNASDSDPLQELDPGLRVSGSHPGSLDAAPPSTFSPRDRLEESKESDDSEVELAQVSAFPPAGVPVQQGAQFPPADVLIQPAAQITLGDKLTVYGY